jgi:hypothetical protein
LDPEQVRSLVDKLQIFGSLQSRDFLDNQQAERYSEQLGARGALSKIQKLIPVFLEEARKWANTLDGAFDLLPEDLSKVDIGGQSLLGFIQGPAELEAFLSTAFGLLLSLVTNVLCLVFFICRHKFTKKIDGKQKEHQQEEYQALEPSAPAPVIYQPAQQLVSLPATHMPYQQRQNRQQRARLAHIMRQV